MGKVYEGSGGGNFPPKIRFTTQEEALPKNTWFIGTKIKQADGKAFNDEKGVPKPANKIFTFLVHEVSEKPELKIQKKQGKQWVDFPLDENGEAELNGNSQLDDKVGQVPMNQKVKVTYLGKALNENSGRYYNNYKVEDAE